MFDTPRQLYQVPRGIPSALAISLIDSVSNFIILCRTLLARHSLLQRLPSLLSCVVFFLYFGDQNTFGYEPGQLCARQLAHADLHRRRAPCPCAAAPRAGAGHDVEPDDAVGVKAYASKQGFAHLRQAAHARHSDIRRRFEQHDCPVGMSRLELFDHGA